MNLRKSCLAVAVGSLLGLPLAASALTIDGITFTAGAILETIDLFEGELGGNGVIDNIGEELVGIGIVNRILDASNNVLWENGDNGRELTVVFRNYIAESIDVGAIGAPINQSFAVINFTGGTVEIYSDDTPDFSAAGTQAQGIASASDGNLFLSLAGSPVGGVGAVSGNPITLISTALGPLAGNPLQSSLNLTGRGLLDVTGGLAASYFDTNTFGCVAGDGAPCPDDADKSFTSSGQLAPSTASSWAFRGTGEVQDFAIPEPGTLALLGAGLVGIAARRRKAA